MIYLTSGRISRRLILRRCFPLPFSRIQACLRKPSTFFKFSLRDREKKSVKGRCFNPIFRDANTNRKNKQNRVKKKPGAFRPPTPAWNSRRRQTRWRNWRRRKVSYARIKLTQKKAPRGESPRTVRKKKRRNRTSKPVKKREKKAKGKHKRSAEKLRRLKGNSLKRRRSFVSRFIFFHQ